MENPLEIVKHVFSKAISELFPDFGKEAVVTVSNPNFGDYQCNSCMNIFSQFKGKMDIKSPKDIGGKLKEYIEKSSEFSNYFKAIEVAPQGFVTVKFSDEFIYKRLEQLKEMDEIKVTPTTRYSCKSGRAKPKVVVDFSSPNIAKEMHVGHLRSTIIGDTICRILEFLEFEVLRINHVGDWGTQFGMLIEYMKEEYPDFMDDLPEISDLQEFYRSSKKRFDNDPQFKLRSQQSVVKLQSGDEKTLMAWRKICEVSRVEFQKIYDRLEITLEEVGESFYNDMIPETVKMLDQKGILKLDQGAQCVYTKINDVPLMAVKSDGGYGYDSTDLAAVHYRLKVLDADWVIYTTDMGQEEHFLKIFDVAETMGWHDPPKTRLVFVGFGVIQGEDGKKFKTRSGDVVKFTELIDEGVSRAKEELIGRKNHLAKNNQESDAKDISCLDSCDETLHNQTEIDKMASTIGHAAIKYFDLKQNRLTNYKFSFDRMLDPKGNTAVYLLYAYARICAVFRKSNYIKSDDSLVIKRIVSNFKIELTNPIERGISLRLLRFAEVFDGFLSDFYTNRLADYCYELSEIFAQFYTECRIIGLEDPKLEESRLLLCFLTKQILLKGLNLLGINPLEKI
ncbi:arginyl-tRNA synthetase family protein [Cryptosporidium felis]|nr:arginyl-tRNA synthetase family protein [Cryptosporidium felis]